MTKLPKLPIGDSSFESIRQGNRIYVDKTRHIFQMADEGKYYFMSRPRRFGKSLTVSTLRCLFQGRKELFEGLWIAEHGDWEWKEHPVILIDFNGISHDTSENLKLSLQRTLGKTAEMYDVIADAPLIKEQFKELILALYRKTGMRVVILVDGYDKPLLEHLGKSEKEQEIAKANLDILSSFLITIKGGDVMSVLQFVFVTGILRVSAIFSELNNLNNITMTRDYADMLGFTHAELETCFAGYIETFARETGQSPDQIRETLKNYYNGYRFSEKDVRVCNPFSVMMALDERAFENYWFETGTPTFLVNILKENNWYLPKIEDMRATEAIFSVYELDNLKPEALLFQTGYVTITGAEEGLFSFGYPNQEVKTAFLEFLFHSYTQGLRDGSRFVLISKYLRLGDFDAFFETITAIFASIPYTLESKRDEAYFHTIFYLIVCASGANARSEVLSSEGRIDLVMEFPDKVFIIEFKCDQSAEAAIRQIRDKNYADQYKQLGKKIILMGIRFDSEKRNVAEWKVA